MYMNTYIYIYTYVDSISTHSTFTDPEKQITTRLDVDTGERQQGNPFDFREWREDVPINGVYW